MSSVPISIKMLMTLTKKEIPRFKEYITSPYFNKTKRIIKLFDSIEELYINKKLKFDEVKIIQKNYGLHTETNVRKFRYDIGKLKELFEDFVSIQSFKHNELEKKITRLEDFKDRAKGAFFYTEYKRVNKTLKSQKCNTEHFHNKFKVENIKANYELIYKDKRIGDVNYQIISDSIDKDFFTKKLTYSVLMLNRRNIALVEYSFGLKETAVQYLNALNNIEDPIIKCLFYAYKILSGNEREKNYQTLKELLYKYQREISDDIVNILYIILQNNITNIFSERRKYCTEFFELYSSLFEKGFMRVNGKVSAQILKNLVSACIELDKYEYLENFLLKNRSLIYPEILAEDIFNFNYSKMLLYKGDIEKAFDMIVNVQIQDLYYKLALRRLEIMICYEMEDMNRLDYLVDAFKVALTPKRAKNISNRKLLEEKNFINFFIDICRISSKPASRKNYTQTLLQNIKETINVSDQKWLLMKADELLCK